MNQQKEKGELKKTQLSSLLLLDGKKNLEKI